ncbi:hypothetical protein K4K57_002952 [Colletotrichum sp. SAR 10_99]|nr:hypothetical protein K4K57_002952 [Colletotrichum sp. SAR 10_99]
MKITSVVSFLAVAVATAQACGYCQCQYSDGSHCCVAHGNGKTCDEVCNGAAYGVTLGREKLYCNAAGASNCISWSSYQDRKQCIVLNLLLAHAVSTMEVLFKLKPNTDSSRISEMRAAGDAMVGVVPGLRSFTLGPPLASTAHRAQGFDMALMTVMDTEEQVLAYAGHPAHLK